MKTKQWLGPDVVFRGMQSGRLWAYHVIVHCSAAVSNSAWFINRLNGGYPFAHTSCLHSRNIDAVTFGDYTCIAGCCSGVYSWYW